jgi:DNA repair protein RecO (recombination protein O)
VVRVDKEPAYLLHKRPYRDSSMLIEVLTPNYGRVGLVHRGGRRVGKIGTDIQLFCELSLSWSGRGDLFTLTHSDITLISGIRDPQYQLCGLYMNELILGLTPRLSPSESLFQGYQSAIFSLPHTSTLELELRRFEMALLNTAGYGLQLQYDALTGEAIKPDSYYYYDCEAGPIASNVDGRQWNCVSGQTLIALNSLTLHDRRTSREAKQLLRGVIDHHLQGRPILTRDLMSYVSRM